MFILLFAACSTLHNPEKIANSIHLYDHQTEILTGTYFNRPYAYNYNYKTLLEILKINEHNVDSIQLELLGPERLQVTTYKPLINEINYVEGKVVGGTFQIKNERHWLGVPFLFFSNSEDKIRLSVGVLDELIVQHFHYSTSWIFGIKNEKIYTDYYRYSKTLDVIP